MPAQDANAPHFPAGSLCPELPGCPASAVPDVEPRRGIHGSQASRERRLDLLFKPRVPCHARAPAGAIGALVLALVCLCGRPAAAQTGFSLGFSDLNDQPSVPESATTATATFHLVGTTLFVDLNNTAAPPGHTIDMLAFNVNPDITLDPNDAQLVRPTPAYLKLDKNPILPDQDASIFGQFEWLIDFKNNGLKAWDAAHIEIGLLAPFPTSLASQNNAQGWSGAVHFLATSTQKGMANTTWGGSRGAAAVTPEGSSGILLASGVLPLLALLGQRRRRT
jgi:hypothetical protein